MSHILRRTLETGRLALCLLCTLIPAIAQPNAPTNKPDYVVTRPVANIYRNAGVDNVVSQAILGSNVTVLERKAGWMKVRTADDYTGWVQVSDLRPLQDQPYAAGSKVVRVTQLSANLYRTPDVTEHAPILNVPWETRLEVVSGSVDQRGRWLQVRLPDDRLVYVQAGDVSSDFTPLTIEQTISTARRFLGITYTWGGTSAYGYDCSGFTQMLVRQRGILMPRDADVQAAWNGLVPVERKDLQPGDLLYFGASAAKITHTGMYIGNGEFIHDTTNTHPMVQISRLDEMPWTKLLVAARRVKQ